MKTIKLLILNLLFFGKNNLYAQNYPTATTDKLIMHNGKTYDCKVNQVNAADVAVIFTNETAEQKINRMAISRIEYASKRVEEISPRIILSKKRDYDKVMIFDASNNIMGFTKKMELPKKYYKLIAKTTTGDLSIAEWKKIKKYVFKQQGIALLIVKPDVITSSQFANAKATIVNKAYIYSY
jgi:hypothetical protein